MNQFGVELSGRKIMKKLTFYLFLGLLFLVLTNCNDQLPVTNPTTPSILTDMEHETLLPTRRLSSEDMLNISVEIKKLQISNLAENYNAPHYIELYIQISNISAKPIVLKKPRSTGFTGQGLVGFPPSFNDVGIVIGRKDEMAMGVFSTTQFTIKSPFRSVIEVFLYHFPEDFIELQPGGIYSYSYYNALPMVHFDDKEEGEKLPPGDYTLYVAYGNEFVGYTLPTNATPPENYNYLFEPDVQIADINAWVGLITSNIVEFTIPIQNKTKD